MEEGKLLADHLVDGGPEDGQTLEPQGRVDGLHKLIVVLTCRYVFYDCPQDACCETQRMNGDANLGRGQLGLRTVIEFRGSPNT